MRIQKERKVIMIGERGRELLFELQEENGERNTEKVIKIIRGEKNRRMD